MQEFSRATESKRKYEHIKIWNYNHIYQPLVRDCGERLEISEN